MLNHVRSVIPSKTMCHELFLIDNVNFAIYFQYNYITYGTHISHRIVFICAYKVIEFLLQCYYYVCTCAIGNFLDCAWRVVEWQTSVGEYKSIGGWFWVDFRMVSLTFWRVPMRHKEPLTFNIISFEIIPCVS